MLGQTSLDADTLKRLESVLQSVAIRAATNERDTAFIDKTLLQLTDAARNSSKTMTQAKAGIQEIAERLTTLSAHVEEVSAETHEIEAIITAAHELSQGTGQAIDQIQEAMNQLEAQVKNILGISSVIDNIAKTTNILSLNASIEAARAGEHGRGFAVVATEVRKLADQTRDQTQRISADIESVAEQLDVTRGVSDTIRTSFNRLVEAVRHAHDSFQAIGHAMEDAAGNVADSAELGQQQERHMTEVAETFETVLEGFANTSHQLSTLATAVKETARATEDGYQELAGYRYDGTVPLAVDLSRDAAGKAESIFLATGLPVSTFLQCGVYTPYAPDEVGRLERYFTVPPSLRGMALDPVKYHVPYDDTVEPQLNQLVEQYMSSSAQSWILFSIVDLNGYVVACADVDRPALTGDAALDDRNRFKRLLPHPSWVRGSRVGLPESAHWLPNNLRRADLLQKFGGLKRPADPVSPLIQTYIRNNVTVMTLLSQPLYIGDDLFGAVMIAWA